MHRRVLHLLTVILLALPLSQIRAQDAPLVEATITQSVVLPSRFFVGDLVEIRASIRIPTGVRLLSPESLPTPGWGELLEVAFEGEGSERLVRIRVRPFQPGTLTIPELQLGEVSLSGLSIYVDPVLEGRDATLQEPRSQALLPGTQLFVTLIAMAILLLPTITVLLWRGGRRRIARLLGSYRENRPYRRAKRRLKLLHQNMEELDGRRFYIELTTLLREYLSQRVDRSLLAATTRELSQRFSVLTLPRTLSEEMLTLFGYADMVKFAGQQSSLERREQDMEGVSKAIEELHHWKEEHHVGI